MNTFINELEKTYNTKTTENGATALFILLKIQQR